MVLGPCVYRLRICGYAGLFGPELLTLSLFIHKVLSHTPSADRYRVPFPCMVIKPPYDSSFRQHYNDPNTSNIQGVIQPTSTIGKIALTAHSVSHSTPTANSRLHANCQTFARHADDQTPKCYLILEAKNLSIHLTSNPYNHMI